MTVLDLKEVPLWLGETVVDFDTSGVKLTLAVRVPVLDTDDDPDTDFVELELTKGEWEEVDDVDIELDTDGDGVVELVGDALIVSDIVCELDPV